MKKQTKKKSHFFRRCFQVVRNRDMHDDTYTYTFGKYFRGLFPGLWKQEKWKRDVVTVNLSIEFTHIYIKNGYFRFEKLETNSLGFPDYKQLRIWILMMMIFFSDQVFFWRGKQMKCTRKCHSDSFVLFHFQEYINALNVSKYQRIYWFDFTFLTELHDSSLFFCYAWLYFL